MLSMPRRGEGNLRNWSTLLVAAIGIAMMGCGGSDSSRNGGGGGGGGGGGNNTPTVNLPVNGAIDVAYIPGAGRTTGDIWGVWRRVYFDDGLSPQPSQDVNLLKLQLNGYTTPLVVNVPVQFKSLPVDNRSFTTFWLDLERVETEVPSGGIVTAETLLNLPYEFKDEADIRVFKGRRSGLQVFLDSTMFQVNTDPNDPNRVTSIAFLPDRFREINIPANGNSTKLQGFLSDYVSFDISQLPDAQKPQFEDGDIAGRVFFSGDGYGIGGSPTDPIKFEGLTLNTHQPIAGRFSPPTVIAGRPAPGTYSLIQNNPSQVDPKNAKLISLVGIWYDHSEAVLHQTETQMISFPRSRDDNIQDVVLVKQTKSTSATGVDSYRINSLLWGYIQFNADLEKSKVFLFSAKDLTSPANVQPVTQGTVTAVKDVNGNAAKVASDVRTATYSLDDGTTGTLVVFRK